MARSNSTNLTAPGASMSQIEASDRRSLALNLLLALLAFLPAASANTAVDAVFEDVRHFAGEGEPADDVTLLAIRRCPS